LNFLMIWIRFHVAWVMAHSEPVSPEKEPKKKKMTFCKLLRNSIYYGCCICCCVKSFCFTVQCICSLPKSKDQGDDAQDKFGVNYHEYVLWKEGEPIPLRALPKDYRRLLALEHKVWTTLKKVAGRGKDDIPGKVNENMVDNTKDEECNDVQQVVGDPNKVPKTKDVQLVVGDPNNDPNTFQVFYNVPNTSQVSYNVPNTSQVFYNVPNTSQVSNNVPNTSQVFYVVRR